MRDRVPTIEDEFDRLSLVSRDTSTADEKTSVKNRHVQQRFYSHIVAQFDELHRVPTSAQKAGHYDPVLAKLRKLREGITASSNYDAFAVQVYEYSADICLIARNFAELLKSLVGLTNTIYPAAGSTPLHRGAEFAAYMLLYLICYARGSSAQTYGNPRDVMNMYKTFPPWVQDHERVRLAMRVFRALRADLDYVELNALWNVGSTSERVFLECVWGPVQERTLQILSKAYFTFPMDDLLTLLGVRGNDLIRPVVASGRDDRVSKLLRGIVHPDTLEERVVDGVITFRKPKPRIKTAATS